MTQPVTAASVWKARALPWEIESVTGATFLSPTKKTGGEEVATEVFISVVISAALKARL